MLNAIDVRSSIYCMLGFRMTTTPCGIMEYWGTADNVLGDEQRCHCQLVMRWLEMIKNRTQ